MSRKIERTLLLILGVWQVLDGLITIVIYGILQNRSNILGSSIVEFEKLSIPSINMISSVFGMLLIVLGCIHLLISQRYLKDGYVYYKIPFLIIAFAVFSYFIFDLISLGIGMSAGVLILAKNKGIRLSNDSCNI